MRTVGFLAVVCLSGCGAGPDAAILSAYLGLLDAQGPLVAGLSDVSGCDQEPGNEGLPVVFSVPIDASGLSPSDFAITTEGGETTTPTCATLAPADEADENRTVLLTGPLGAEEDPPAAVTVVDALSSEEGVELEGTFLDTVTTVDDGPSVVLALLDPAASTCEGLGSSDEVQTTWAGGITAEFGAELGDAELSAFRLIDGSGGAHTPLGFDDLGDTDNHLVLCVPDGLSPVRVEVDAARLFDPTNHPNPATQVAVTPR